jgi:hypothetical protein
MEKGFDHSKGIIRKCLVKSKGVMRKVVVKSKRVTEYGII